MKLDGTMDFIYQRKLANYWNKSCKLTPAFVPVDPLDYNQTAGVFLGYCAFICVTIVIGFLTIAVGYWHEMAARKHRPGRRHPITYPTIHCNVSYQYIIYHILSTNCIHPLTHPNSPHSIHLLIVHLVTRHSTKKKQSITN